MEIVYIDKEGNIKDEQNVNYTKFNPKVVSVGILFDLGEDTFLAYPDDNKACYSQMYYSFDIKLYVQTKSNSFVFSRIENYVLSDSKYVWETLDKRFGNFETNIYDKNNALKEGLVTEQMFCLNIAKGKYTGDFALSIFDFLTKILIKKYVNHETNF